MNQGRGSGLVVRLLRRPDIPPVALGGKGLLVVAAFTLLYGIILLRTGWVSDDAYITFRAIDNFENGHGLTWNVSERVQVFTHPLWALLLSGIHAYTKELFRTCIVFFR